MMKLLYAYYQNVGEKGCSTETYSAKIILKWNTMLMGQHFSAFWVVIAMEKNVRQRVFSTYGVFFSKQLFDNIICQNQQTFKHWKIPCLYDKIWLGHNHEWICKVNTFWLCIIQRQNPLEFMTYMYVENLILI